MSERTVEEIRSEITAERQGLNDDLTALQSEIQSLGLRALLSSRSCRGVEGHGKASRRFGSSLGSPTQIPRRRLVASTSAKSSGQRLADAAAVRRRGRDFGAFRQAPPVPLVASALTP